MLRSLSIPGVRRLALLYATADLLDWCGAIALMLLVYGQTGSAFGAGAMLVCKQIVPGLLTTAAGRLLDRYPSGRIIGIGFLIQASAVLAIGGLGYGPALFVLAVGSGLGGTVARASFRTTIAKGLSGDERRLTTALIHATMGTISLVAPAFAAALATATSPGDVLVGAGLAGLALGAFTLFGPAIRLGDAASPGAAAASGADRASAPADSVDASPIEATASDLETTGLMANNDVTTSATADADHAATSSIPLLLPLPILFAITAAITTGFAMDEPSLLPYSEQSLDAGAGGYGAILSFWGVGIVAGSFAFGRIMGRSMLVLAAIGTAIAAGGYLGLAVAPTIAVACAVSVVGGFGNGFNWIALVTAVQEATPEDRQGQAATNLEAIATVGPAVGFLIGGALADAASPRLTLLIPGLLALAILGAATALAVLRQRNQRAPVATA